MNKFFIPVLLVWSFLVVSANAQQDSTQKILLLNSYHRGFKWTEDITKATIETLKKNGIQRHQLHIEYMDTKRYTNRQHYKNLLELYISKYKNTSFQAILCSDNNAYNFLKQHRKELFGNVPVFFCGINLFDTTQLNLPYSKGLAEHVDYKEGIRLALNLHPNTGHIYFIADQSVTGRQVHKKINSLIPELDAPAKFHILTKHSMPEILDTLRNIPENSLIYFTLFFKDKRGNFYDYDESAKIISNATEVPVYGAWDFSLNNGIVGGLLTSGYYQGKIMTEKAVEYINGTPLSKISISHKSANKYMFDYRQLKRHNINMNKLPKNAIVTNQPVQLLKTYKTEIIAGIISIIVLTVLVLLLFANIIKRKKAEQARAYEHARLDEFLSERTRFLKTRIDDLTRALLEKNHLQGEVETLKKTLTLKQHELEGYKQKLIQLQAQLDKKSRGNKNPD